MLNFRVFIDLVQRFLAELFEAFACSAFVSEKVVFAVNIGKRTRGTIVHMQLPGVHDSDEYSSERFFNKESACSPTLENALRPVRAASIGDAKASEYVGILWDIPISQNIVWTLCE